MDNTNISQSLSLNVDSSSLSPTLTLMETVPTPAIVGKKKRGRPANAFKSGAEWNGNAKGKPKGTIQIKDCIRKALTHADGDLIAKEIISASISGDDKKQDRLLKLTGDFNDAPQVNLTSNTTLISSDVIEMARQLILARDNSIGGIITDISSSVKMLN
jgi:hypothetical protein